MPQKTETCNGVGCPRELIKKTWPEMTQVPNEIIYEILQTTEDNHVLYLLAPYAKGLPHE